MLKKNISQKRVGVIYQKQKFNLYYKVYVEKKYCSKKREGGIYPPPTKMIRNRNLPTQKFTHIVGYYNVCLLNYINIKNQKGGGAIKTQRGLILINLPTQQLTHIVSYYIVCLLNYINIKKSGRGGGYKNKVGPNPYQSTYPTAYPYCKLLHCIPAKLYKHQKIRKGGGL